MSAAKGEIASVEDEIGRGRFEIREGSLKGSAVAVNIGDDCDSHFCTVLPLFLRRLWASISGQVQDKRLPRES